MNRHLNPIKSFMMATLGGLLLFGLAPTGAVAQRTTPVTVVNNVNNPVPVSVQESVVAGCDRTIRSVFASANTTPVVAFTVSPGKIFVLTDVIVRPRSTDPVEIQIAGSIDPTVIRHIAYGATPSGSGGAGQHLLSGIFFSPEEDVLVLTLNAGSERVTLSGYEIDAPAP